MDNYNLQIGELLNNRYLIVDKFIGTMGVAYFVEDRDRSGNTSIPEKLIAKTLHPNVSSTKSFYNRFLDEASIWIDIGHKDNVVHAYKVESIDGIPFVFAEYIRKSILPNSLAEWIHYRLTPPEIALYFIVQVLDGLWYSYQDGVQFHGDLKPSNVLITEDIVVKINDWGFAHSTKRKELTSEEINWFKAHHGSGPYIAPEVKITPSKQTRAMDGYAIGVLLGEMLCYEQFSSGTNKNAILKSFLDAELEIPEDILYSLTEIIEGLLTPLWEDRIYYYEKYAAKLANIFSLLTGIGTTDESDSIIITAVDPKHAENVKKSKIEIETMKSLDQNTDTEE